MRTKEILEKVRAGEMTPDEAALQLKLEPFEEMGFAKIDHHRALRQGSAEVIYGASKTPEQIAEIATAITALACISTSSLESSRCSPATPTS